MTQSGGAEKCLKVVGLRSVSKWWGLLVTQSGGAEKCLKVVGLTSDSKWWG